MIQFNYCNYAKPKPKIFLFLALHSKYALSTFHLLILEYFLSLVAISNYIVQTTTSIFL